jgi:hypothetical protein
MTFFREMLKKYGLLFTTIMIKLLTAFVTTTAIISVAWIIHWFVTTI